MKIRNLMKDNKLNVKHFVLEIVIESRDWGMNYLTKLFLTNKKYVCSIEFLIKFSIYSHLIYTWDLTLISDLLLF